MKRYSLLLVIFGSVLWGTDSLFRRPLSESLSPVTIVFLEHCVLCLVLAPVVIVRRREIANLNSRDWAALIFIALGGSVAATSLFTYSIKYGNPSVTVLLQKSQPLFTILLARWLLHERPGKAFWLLTVPAVAGGYLVSTPEWRQGFALDPRQPGAIFAAVGAATLWGCSTVFGRHIVARLPVFALTALRFVIALPVLAAMYLLQPAGAAQLPATRGATAMVIAMALIPGLAALAFYYKGLQNTIASLASLGELAFPVTAVTTNWLLLDIRLASSQFIGGALLVLSVTAVTWLEGRRSNPQQTGPIARRMAE